MYALLSFPVSPSGRSCAPSGGTADKRYNLIVIITFGDIIESAVLNGLHPVRDITVRRQQDYLYVRGCFLDRRHKVYPVTVRKKYIAQDYIRALNSNCFKAVLQSPAWHTSYPSNSNIRDKRVRICTSSSTTKILLIFFG